MKNFNASVSRRSLLTSFAAGLGVVALGGLTACGGSSAPAGLRRGRFRRADRRRQPTRAARRDPERISPRLFSPSRASKLKVKEYTDYIQPNKDTSPAPSMPTTSSTSPISRITTRRTAPTLCPPA
ncbi:MAG: hypothetical protein ACLTSX_09160 [Collinsella sp.]